MKIWSYPGIYPYPEGNDLTTGIFIHKQNLAIKQLGYDIEVVQPWDEAPIWPFYKLFKDWGSYHERQRPDVRFLEGIKVHHPKVFVPKPSRVFKKPHHHYLLNTLESFLRSRGLKKGKDIIHAQWLIPDGHIAVQLGKRLGIPVSVEMQGDDIVVWPHNSETHLKHALWTLQNADLVSGCSDFLCNEAKKLYKNPINTHTIYTGIDVHKFKPLEDSQLKSRLRQQYNIAENDIVVLNVGSPIQRKGWLELFESVANLKLKYPNIKILAASGGLQDFKLIDKAKEFGVADRLIDLGQVKNENLLALYQLCDIFALPSYWEGLANVLCEAMSCGCAVVTSAVAGHPEVVQNGINGLLIEPRSVSSLTSALDQMMASSELRERFGREARKTAETKIMSHEANAQRLIKLFETIL